MNIESIINFLKEDTDFNFIGIGVTPLHVNGIDAAIEYLNSDGIEVNGYVLMMEHKATGRAIAPSSFNNEIEKINYLEFENKEENRIGLLKKVCRVLVPFKSKRHVSNKRIVYLVSPDISYKWVSYLEAVDRSIEIRYILIDDGAGSYVDKLKNVVYSLKYERVEKREATSKYFVSLVKTYVKYFYDKMFISLLKKRENLVVATLFIKSIKDGTLKRNTRIMGCYRKSFKKQGEGISKEILNLYEDCILINTQCLEECGMTNGVLDFEVYKRVIDELNMHMQVPIIIKPHPREMRAEKYMELNAKVHYGNDYAQEAILANLSVLPRCVISIFSSTLLNATGIFDIPAVSLAKIVLKEDIDQVFEAQLLEFISEHEKFLLFPETVEELLQILCLSNN